MTANRFMENSLWLIALIGFSLAQVQTSAVASTPTVKAIKPMEYCILQENFSTVVCSDNEVSKSLWALQRLLESRTIPPLEKIGHLSIIVRAVNRIHTLASIENNWKTQATFARDQLIQSYLASSLKLLSELSSSYNANHLEKEASQVEVEYAILAFLVEEGATIDRLKFATEYYPGNANAWRLLGYFQLREKNLDIARNSYSIALDIFSKNQDSTGMALTFYSLGYLNLLDDQLEKSENYLEKSLTYFAKLKGDISSLGKALTYTNLAMIYHLREEWHLALDKHQKSLVLIDGAGLKPHVGSWTNYYYMGLIKEKLTAYDEALEMYLQAYLQSTPVRAARILERMGYVYQAKGESNLAIRSWNNALDVYKDLKNENETKRIKELIRILSSDDDL